MGLSAVLIAKDEEERLGAALASAAFCDEVLVVDGGSSDGTCARAAEAGARVVVNAPWPGFTAQRNFAVAAARHDWVLCLDADERVTPALRAEIVALRAGGFASAAGWRIPRLSFYLGAWVRATDWWPDPQLRLFDRRRGSWQGGLVHESVHVEGTAGRLRGWLEHHPYDDVADHVRTIDAYTTLWAEEAFGAGRRVGPVTPVLAAGWAFLRNAVLKRGLLLGEVGLTVSTLNAFYTFLKLAKLRERARRAA